MKARVGRRSVLRGLVGLLGAAVLPGALASCGSSDPGVASAPTPTGSPPAPEADASPVVSAAPIGTVTLVSVAPLDDVTSAFTKETGIRVRTSTQDFPALGETIAAYLAGSPEDVEMWIAGPLMRQLAGQGLLASVDDIWSVAGRSFSPLLKDASRGDDGHLYAIPYAHGPWAVFYRKSVFADRSYEIPGTWTEYLTLADRMRRDGMVATGFGDQDQFPALGVFDILNLRLNGYQFHVDLLAGHEDWTDRRVQDTLDLFRRFLETAGPDPVSRGSGDAVASVIDKQAGMTYFGTFITAGLDDSVISDLGMFAFPLVGSGFDQERAVEDPTDAFIVPARSPTRAADLDSTKAFLEYVCRPDVALTISTLAGGPGSLPGVSLAAPSPLQAEATGIIEAARHATQFLDRDTDQSFAGPFGELLKTFIADPGQRIAPFLDQVQSAWTGRA